MPYMTYMVIDKQIKRTYTWLKQRERELKGETNVRQNY
jgi:hypothetical protein